MEIVIIVACGLLAYLIYRGIREIRKRRYFASEEFLAHKWHLSGIVAEHNAIANYAAEIRSRGSFQLGISWTGSHAHLAQSQNTSRHNYRRDRNAPQYAPNVHNCSLQIVRNAAQDPIKYLMKYFGIKAEEAHLADVERLGESVARLEGAVANLHARENGIKSSFNPPPFILKHYANEFMAQVGVSLAPIEIPYPVYTFEYVSAGGNSSQRTPIVLYSPTIDALIGTLSQRIRWRQSAAGQRALMTAHLREFIKNRDNYACRQCAVSVMVEPHLLLEVDHIIPVSRGGLSTVDNLQTLCWKCNRSKSNRMPAA